MTTQQSEQTTEQWAKHAVGVLTHSFKHELYCELIGNGEFRRVLDARLDISPVVCEDITQQITFFSKDHVLAFVSEYQRLLALESKRKHGCISTRLLESKDIVVEKVTRVATENDATASVPEPTKPEAVVPAGFVVTPKLYNTVKNIIKDDVNKFVSGHEDCSGFLDSLDFMEIIMAVESEYKIEIPDHEAERIRTGMDMVTYLRGCGVYGA